MKFTYPVFVSMRQRYDIVNGIVEVEGVRNKTTKEGEEKALGGNIS